jgi:hypothetical protein
LISSGPALQHHKATKTYSDTTTVRRSFPLIRDNFLVMGTGASAEERIGGHHAGLVAGGCGTKPEAGFTYLLRAVLHSH